ncbi:MAG: lysine--tRNA ligase [Candidatus Omnitrophica bacterium]|nr:lysine--tRNA ligase [Candidatus Omnitrophota bacterium]
MVENELITQRKDKLKALKDKGLDPYLNNSFSRDEIGICLSRFEEGRKAAVAGRLMQKRLHGKAAFADLRDSTGTLQLYFAKDALGDEKFEDFKCIDIADILGVKGEMFKTRTGQVTLKVFDFTLLSKAVRPLPEKWHGLKDVETRYRQRYLDIIANSEAGSVFILRSGIISCLREFLDERGYLEVETPMMHPIPGGAAGRPFQTHHNEYDIDLYLRIAPELYLKKLLVAGFDKVYEINRSFRNEGVSTMHNPEFTMLEVYEAFTDYQGMMELCEEMIVYVINKVAGGTKIEYQGRELDFQRPWKRVSFAGLVKEKFGISPSDPLEDMVEKLRKKGKIEARAVLTRTQVTKIIEDLLEEDMPGYPVMVTDYFTSMSPLAKARKDDPLVCERFELFISGIEVGNAYSELNDPFEQRKRFIEEIEALPGEEKKNVDEDFLLALEQGMPPAGGLGIGIDRLVMLLSNQPSIRDVILFPLLRPGQ